MLHAPAFAQAAGTAGGASLYGQLMLTVLLFAIFWFLLIRPQQKRLKEHRAMVAAVQKGDEVVTGGGLMGKVVRVADDNVEIELAQGVRVRAVKSTLTSVQPRGSSTVANDTKE